MRKSGILLHITSLPGPYGIGTLGREAYAFVDFLKKAGQSVWQVLPLNPTGFGNSPYQCCSAFAGNPYLIDLPTLVAEGLLDQALPDRLYKNAPGKRVDFGLQYETRRQILQTAYSRFPGGEAFDRFCRDNRHWLFDFALFQALKDAHGGAPWYEWTLEWKFRQPEAMASAGELWEEPIRFYCFQQYLFYRQWHALHRYARSQGIEIIGDVPFYVPLDSVDVWSAPELYQLDENRVPTAVAGCPPDAFSPDGQLWGNPLYRWEAHKETGYRWWIRRIQTAARRCDCLRLDHFRGFESYWSVPFGRETARAGKWRKGPGLPFLEIVQKAAGNVPFIAEDLGFITPAVKDLRDRAGIPGMKVLQFAFEPGTSSEYLPHNCIPRAVCYTGTHDNMPLGQWLDSLSQPVRQYATEYMQLNPNEDPLWGVVRTALSTVCQICILQMQDVLGLGSEARMNFPGTQSDENWTWRLEKDSLTDALAEKLRSLTGRYGRLGCENFNAENGE